MTANIFRPINNYYTMDDDTLGTGGYAVVRKATHKQTGKVYAVKIMRLGKSKPDTDDSSDDEATAALLNGVFADSDSDDASLTHSDKYDMSMSYDEIMNEIDMVVRLDHPNIIHIHEYFINRYSLAAVLLLFRPYFPR